MKFIRYMFIVLKNAARIYKNGEELLAIPLSVWESHLEQFSSMRDHADRLWAVIDRMIAGKSACESCEFAPNCPQKQEHPNGCKDWCLSFEEEVTSDEPRPETSSAESAASV